MHWLRDATVVSACLLISTTAAAMRLAEDPPGGPRPPVVFVDFSGIPQGALLFALPSTLSLQPHVLRALQAGAALHRYELAVTIDPAHADYLLFIDAGNDPWSPWETWTVVDAASGIILIQERSLLLENALRQAAGAIGGLWSRRGVGASGVRAGEAEPSNPE